MISCIVIDDEPIARKGLSEYVRKIPFLALRESFSDSLSALEFLNEHEIDLMILDVNMPEVSGIQLLKSLKNRPLTIIVSAYPEYAVEGFDLDVIDYIVKPVAFERLMKAANKAKDYLDLRNRDKGSSDHFFIKSENKIERIVVNEIFFIESLHNYVKIYTQNRKYMTLLTLKSLEEFLPSGKFMKVHKSYIVNIEKINSVEGDELNINNEKIPVSRSLKEEILQKLVGKNLLKR
jgi:DNA-binding LytR/AlgR family response regulator